ncbi:hypothetical protein [Streptomyces sp. IMTB 1903]|nr:hypothetical protein [Streptomyces sp. IMTB 1903]
MASRLPLSKKRFVIGPSLAGTGHGLPWTSPSSMPPAADRTV